MSFLTSLASSALSLLYKKKESENLLLPSLNLWQAPFLLHVFISTDKIQKYLSGLAENIKFNAWINFGNGYCIVLLDEVFNNFIVLQIF